MKKTIFALAMIGLLALGGQGFAEFCTMDAVPAATLLLPYFEVDLNDASGVTTLFSVNNASAAPQLVHVVIWSDLSVPALDFEIFLTGYDVQTVNMRDIIADGNLPVTGYVVSPQGDYSLPNGAAPAACAGKIPYTNPALSNTLLTSHLQPILTGGATSFYGGLCGGVNFGDNIARGYVTMDTVSTCSLETPASAGYFAGIAEYDNVLWGDYFYVDTANNFAQGDTLVHIEADGVDATPGVYFLPGDYTYYGRYVAATAVDQREPLATTHASRYLNGGVFTGGTDFICWRDTGIVQNPFTCGTIPLPFPLAATQIVIFDEQETPNIPQGCQVSPCPPTDELVLCPWEATRQSTADFAFNFGWAYMNLNTTTGGVFDPYKQSAMAAVMDASGLFSVGLSSISLDSACAPNDVILPVPGTPANP